jgi:hypothetical protein
MGRFTLYAIPASLIERFIAHIDTVAVVQADGGVTLPIHERVRVIGTKRPVMLHLIKAVEVPADHPDALVYRMQHREAFRNCTIDRARGCA